MQENKIVVEPNEVREFARPEDLGKIYILDVKPLPEGTVLQMAPPIKIGMGVGNIRALATSMFGKGESKVGGAS